MLEYSNFTGRVPAVNKSTTCCLYGIPEREVGIQCWHSPAYVALVSLFVVSVVSRDLSRGRTSMQSILKANQQSHVIKQVSNPMAITPNFPYIHHTYNCYGDR